MPPPVQHLHPLHFNNILTQSLSVRRIDVAILTQSDSMCHIDAASNLAATSQVEWADATSCYVHQATPYTPYRPDRKLFNKRQHATNGNRHHLGIKSCTWNCNRGLLDSKGRATDKVSEIHQFMLANMIDIMALNEAGIHGPRSHTIRATPMSDTSLHRELALPGYRILLLESWSKHDTARIMVYVRAEINTSTIQTQTHTADLPVISFTARKGAEAKTAFTFYYREFTGGVSGIRTQEAQAERLSCLLAHWEEVGRLGLDLVHMGDMNLCIRPR